MVLNTPQGLSFHRVGRGGGRFNAWGPMKILIDLVTDCKNVLGLHMNSDHKSPVADTNGLTRLTSAVASLFLLFSCAASQAHQKETPRTNPGEDSQEPYVYELLRTNWRFENDGNGQEESYARIRVQSQLGVQSRRIFPFLMTFPQRSCSALIRLANSSGVPLSTVKKSSTSFRTAGIP
jgi:hypothetical protein